MNIKAIYHHAEGAPENVTIVSFIVDHGVPRAVCVRENGKLVSVQFEYLEIIG